MHAHTGKWLMLAGLVVAIALNSPLPGAEPSAKDEANDGAAAANDDGSPKKKDRAVGARDPVASAFALPKGVVLNPAQQAAYDDLKQKYEAQLRQAFDDVQHAEDAAATAQARKEVRESRAKIRTGIQEILAMPYREAAEKASQQSSGSVPGAPGPGNYVPPYGNYGGIGPWYPYYPGSSSYPNGSYPYRSYGRYPTSNGTTSSGTGQGGSSTGSSSTTGKSPGATQPAPKPPATPAPKPPAKPAPKPPAKPAPKPRTTPPAKG